MNNDKNLLPILEYVCVCVCVCDLVVVPNRNERNTTTADARQFRNRIISPALSVLFLFLTLCVFGKASFLGRLRYIRFALNKKKLIIIIIVDGYS